MASLRTWRTMAGALLLAMVLAITSTTATAWAPTDVPYKAHYCKQVDAYRIRTCATALLPAGPLGQQLRWELDQLAGEAVTLTEAKVRAHLSADFLTVMLPPEVVVQFFQQNLAERGPFTFIGFAYPPRARQALALVQTATGERGALPIGVTGGGRPALIEYLDLQQAPPVVVPKGRLSGWFDVGGRRLFLRCVGRGSPTVVFEPWSRNDPAPTPRTARDVVIDLHTLLGAARVPGPYVLAGHSNGGLFTLLYASTYRRQVAGLVLIDAVHPATIKRRLAMLKPILPPEEWEAVRQLMIAVPHRLRDPERVDIWTSERQTRVALRGSPIRPMPLVCRPWPPR